MPMAAKAASHHQGRRGASSARRWSSQIMEGRNGCPSAPKDTVVPRCVVTTTPAIDSLGTAVLAHRRWQAWLSVCQKASGSFSIQPGWGDW